MDSALVGEHRGRIAQCQRDHPSESAEREGGRRWPHLVDAFFPPTDVLETVILNGRSLLVVALAGDEVFDHLIVRRRAPRPAPNCCKHLRAAVLSVCLIDYAARVPPSKPNTSSDHWSSQVTIRQRSLCDTVTIACISLHSASRKRMWNRARQTHHDRRAQAVARSRKKYDSVLVWLGRCWSLLVCSASSVILAMG